MDIWEIDKLKLFILFVIPGFISLKTYQLLVPNLQKDPSSQLIDAITYSCVNYAILSVPILYIQNNNVIYMYPNSYYIFYFFVFFIAPILWAYLFKKLRNLEYFQNYAPHPTLKPWDYVFSQRKSFWIKVTLIDKTVVGGKYSSKSFTSSYPSQEQIFLEESWIINNQGGFERMKNGSKGIIIMEKEISYLEFIEYEE